MADVERSFSPLRGSPLQSPQDEPDDLSTLPDPRSRALSPADATDDDATPHPDLSNEVATLSNKLISAINHQTSLDDTLSSTRHELDSARGRIRQLEMEVENYANKISSGTLIMSGVAQAEKDELLTSLAKERRQREEMEKGKKHMEQELENLTQALFEEANKVGIPQMT
jgi:chromosome segregation ATPase